MEFLTREINGLFKDLGVYKLKALPSLESKEPYELIIICDRVGNKSGNYQWTYTLVDSAQQHVHLQRNGWKSASIFSTNNRFSPDLIMIDIVDPDGLRRSEEILGRHSQVLLNLVARMENLSLFKNWEQALLKDELLLLRKENERLLQENIELKNSKATNEK